MPSGTFRPASDEGGRRDHRPIAAGGFRGCPGLGARLPTPPINTELKGLLLRVPERLLKHACVALAVMTLPVVAPRALHAATATTPPPPIAIDGAVQAAAVLEANPGGPMYTERPAQTIRAAAGDTLATLAAEFHSDAAAMRWANGVVDVTEPIPGRAVLIPPGPGSLVELTRAAKPSEVAATLGLDPRVILDYNVLRSDDPLAAGHWLQVPRVVAPRTALPSDIVVPDANGAPSVPSTQKARGNDTFPYGQCTYYVASRRNVTWGGDAWMWFSTARVAGRPEGQVPVIGSIMVSWESWVGHVAYVEHVNSDGSFVVQEMNVRGWGVVDERTVSPGKTPIIGFIY
jgi:surface antigen